MTDENIFRQQFKYYKQKKPPPCLDAVIDVNNPRHACFFTALPTDISSSALLSAATDLPVNPPTCWRVLASNLNRGFWIIAGALAPDHELYWAHRCLRSYSARTASRRNIDTACPDIGDWFAEALVSTDGGLRDRLRWATMGYHHNWDTKVGGTYLDDKKSFARMLFWVWIYLD